MGNPCPLARLKPGDKVLVLIKRRYTSEHEPLWTRRMEWLINRPTVGTLEHHPYLDALHLDAEIEGGPCCCSVRLDPHSYAGWLILCDDLIALDEYTPYEIPD